MNILKLINVLDALNIELKNVRKIEHFDELEELEIHYHDGNYLAISWRNEPFILHNDDNSVKLSAQEKRTIRRLPKICAPIRTRPNYTIEDFLSVSEA